MAKADRNAYEVHLDAPELGVLQKVGTLYRHETRTDLPPAFEYDREWLGSGNRFMLDPRLELWKGEQHPVDGAAAFGIFQDSAPDRWGRVLMERREAAKAKREGRKIQALQDMDFLLGVHDTTRSGGLRFRAAQVKVKEVTPDDAPQENPFLDNSENAAPPVTQLKELAYISQRLEEPGVDALPEYERWLAMLIAPGTSLGGARPKANFLEDDRSLWIAKFPSHDDRYDVGGWEFVTHTLARAAGVRVPASRLDNFGQRYGTFCVSRFDRTAAGRRVYASAMTMLQQQDGQGGAGYLDLAEFISDQGAQGHVDEDLEQLFRRVVFNVLVGNRDDHLRNHGFVREATGWRLSDAFDINPNLAKVEHSLTLDGNSAAPDVSAVLDTAELYRLNKPKATQVLAEVTAVVATWRDVAKRNGMAATEVQRMASVFDV